MQAADQRSFDSHFTQITFAYYEARYANKEYIGKGSGSIVYRAWDQNSKKNVAIKQYNRNQLHQQNQVDVVREIELLEFLSMIKKTQHVVKFEGAFRVATSVRGFIYCIILQLCETSLDQYIKSPEFATLSWENKLQLCLFISQGVNFLHQRSVIHRDLKPGNILLAYRDGKQTPLIGDFGHAKLWEARIANTNLRGTIRYAEPDLLYSTEYGLEWDIYSLGLIILEVMSGGQFLFKISLDINTEMKFIKKMKAELSTLQQALNNIPGLSPEIKTLVWECLKNKQFQASEVVAQIKRILQNLKETRLKVQQDGSDKIPNFQKNKQPSTQDKKPKINSKISTIESEQSKQINNLEELIQQSQKATSQFQSNNESSFKITQSNQRIRNVDSEIKKLPKRSSQIVLPASENKILQPEPQPSISLQLQMELQSQSQSQSQSQKQAKMRYTGVDLNLLGDGDEQTTHQSQKPYHKLPEVKIQRSSSFNSQKREEKFIVLSKQTNKEMQIIPKMIKAKQNLSTKLLQQTQAVEGLKDLQSFKQKFLGFRQIQECRIEIKHKMKLLLVCLKYLINSLRIHINEKGRNKYSIKYLTIYLENLIAIEKPLRDEFFDKYLIFERRQSQQVLKAHQPALELIKKQFEFSLEKLDKPMLMFQLQKLLQ